MTESYKQAVFVAVFLFVGWLSLSQNTAAYALIDLNVGGSADAGTNVEAESSESSAQNETGVNSEIDFSAEVIGQEQRMGVTRADLESQTEAEAQVDSGAVITSGDLQAYARATLRSDDSVDQINFTRNQVEVRYQQTGRLLALFPVSFIVSARTHADGTVEVDYPWYAFLTIDNEDKVSTDLRVAVDTALRSRTVGTVRAEGEVSDAHFTASESAQVAAEMQRVLKASLEQSNGTQVE